MAVNWDELKTEYVTGTISVRGLAQKYGLSRTTIAHNCKNGNWVEERRRYRNRVVTKTVDLCAQRDMTRLFRIMDGTKKALDVALGALDDDKQFYTYRDEVREKYDVPVDPATGEAWDPDTSDGMGVVEYQRVLDVESKKLDTRSLKDLVTILKDLTTMTRELYDLPTAAQDEQRKIALERLEMEKRKADQGDTDDDETGVVFLPPRLEAKDE